jgi:trehalose 6-phosphate phosphatase
VISADISPQGRAGLDAVRREPGSALIASDFDGTLAPIVLQPADARPQPGAIQALTRLAAVAGTVAIITGRPALSVIKVGGLDAIDGLVVLGHYGDERWVDGELTSPPAPPGIQDLRQTLPDALTRAGAPPGTRIEDKGTALAVHTRQTADPAGALDLLRPVVGALAEQANLTIQPGRYVLEVRAGGSDKGSALKDLVEQRGARSVVFCGDDLGDLPAFAAVRGLRARGIPGCAVSSGSQEAPQVAAEADLQTDGPGGIVAFLEALAVDLGA